MEFFNSIKGQFNSLNLILFAAAIGAVLRWRRKRLGIWILYFAAALFLLFSTDYLPRYIAAKMEHRYKPLTHCSDTQFDDSKMIIIHVLGGGYTMDPQLPSHAQLSSASEGRLMEGLRLLRCWPQSKLVCSGYIASGTLSMAEVAKNAAVSVGVDSSRVILLEKPSTTYQEAMELSRLFKGSEINLVVVTSAIHMARSISFFQRAGFNPVAAPTNFIIKKDKSFRFGMWPSIDNLHVMDVVIREFFGSLIINLQ